ISVKAVDPYGNEGGTVTRTWNVGPRQNVDIRAIRTQPIPDGTYVKLSDYAGDYLRISYIDREWDDRYWVQHTNGDTNPDNAGIMVWPYYDSVNDVYHMPHTSELYRSPTITGVVWRDPYGETMLVDAERGYNNDATHYTYARYVWNDADELRLPENQGLIVTIGGIYRPGSGAGCPSASGYLEACVGSNRVVCLMGLAPYAFDDLVYNDEATIVGIPTWTPNGIILGVIEAYTAGSDVCL